MSMVNKHRARTKHLNVKLQHFRYYVTCVKVTILPIVTLDQASDYRTKVINQSMLDQHRLTVQGC